MQENLLVQLQENLHAMVPENLHAAVWADFQEDLLPNLQELQENLEE